MNQLRLKLFLACIRVHSNERKLFYEKNISDYGFSRFCFQYRLKSKRCFYESDAITFEFTYYTYNCDSFEPACIFLINDYSLNTTI